MKIREYRLPSAFFAGACPINKIEDVIVVGAGPAGLAAAIQLKRYGIAPRVFEKDAVGGLLRNANLVENYPGFPGGIAGADLVRLFEAQARGIGLEIDCAEVLELDYQGGLFRARTARETFAARIAVLATGTRPRTLDSPSVPAGVREKIYYEVYPLAGVQGKEIAILGAGDAAFDYGLSLAKGNQVSILNRGATRRCLPLLWERTQANAAIRYYENIAVINIQQAGPERPSLRSGLRLRLECRGPEGSLELQPHFLVAAFGRDARLEFLTERVKSLAPELEGEGRLYLIGDVANGIYRQTSIAVGNGVLAAMKIYTKITEGAL